jgi:hypothetical protein
MKTIAFFILLLIWVLLTIPMLFASFGLLCLCEDWWDIKDQCFEQLKS